MVLSAVKHLSSPVLLVLSVEKLVTGPTVSVLLVLSTAKLVTGPAGAKLGKTCNRSYWCFALENMHPVLLVLSAENM